AGRLGLDSAVRRQLNGHPADRSAYWPSPVAHGFRTTPGGAALRWCWGAERASWSHAGADVLFQAPGTTSRPLLDDFRVQELSDELDAETGIGSGVLGVELELGVGEFWPVGVDHEARRADDDQLAVHHVRLDAQDIRGDRRVGEVEGDSALLRAKLDARGYWPAPLPYVPAAVLLNHEYVVAFGCGRDRQVGGEPGQLAERPGLKRALQPGVEFLGAEPAVTGGAPQRIHDARAHPRRWPPDGQVAATRRPLIPATRHPD